MVGRSAWRSDARRRRRAGGPSASRPQGRSAQRPPAWDIGRSAGCSGGGAAGSVGWPTVGFADGWPVSAWAPAPRRSARRLVGVTRILCGAAAFCRETCLSARALVHRTPRRWMPWSGPARAGIRFVSSHMSGRAACRPRSQTVMVFVQRAQPYRRCQCALRRIAVRTHAHTHTHVLRAVGKTISGRGGIHCTGRPGLCFVRPHRGASRSCVGRGSTNVGLSHPTERGHGGSSPQAG